MSGTEEISVSATFIAKLMEVPMVKSAATVVCSVYLRVKGHNTLCQVGLTMTEDALQKVFIVLRPLRKQYNSSLDSKLSTWLTAFEKDYPKIMVPFDQVVMQSRECCLYYVDQATNVICQSPASRACLNVADWIMAWLYLFAKLQAKQILAARRSLRKIQNTRHAKTLRDFASPRRFVSPKKRISLIAKWSNWINGAESNVKLQSGTDLDDTSDASLVDSSLTDSADKKRKRDEGKSDSDGALSDILEDYVSDDDADYRPPTRNDLSSTDSLEYKETSDAGESSDDDVEDAPEAEEEFCSPIPEADRSVSV